MTAVARAGPGAPGFVADDAHPGTSEAAWLASQELASLRPLAIPRTDHVMVVAPHPDDEVLGAGGLLQILAGLGARIEICAVTDGEGSHPEIDDDRMRCVRTAESHDALGRLGIPAATRTRRGIPDGQVAATEAELARFLSGRLGPTSLCLAPWHRERHPDHDACGRAAAVAADATGAVLLSYLVWAWHWADPSRPDLPWAACRRIGLDRRQVARKRWATAAFRSQTQPFGPGPGAPPVLPGPVMRRFWRPFEVYVV